MKTYYWRTDAGSGTVKAATLTNALKAVCRDEGVTKAAIEDGGWAWVEDPDTGRREEIGIVP